MEYSIKKIHPDVQILNSFYSTIESLIDVFVYNYDNTSAREKFNSYRRMYNLTINQKDYLKILSRIKGTDFYKYVCLDTYAEDYDDKNNAAYRKLYLCAVRKGFIAYTKRYTPDEINVLTDANVIVPIAIDFHHISELSPDRKNSEDYQVDCFSNHFYQDYLHPNFEFAVDDSCVDVAVKYLEENINRNRVVKDLKKLIFTYYATVTSCLDELESKEDEASKYKCNILQRLADETTSYIKFN